MHPTLWSTGNHIDKYFQMLFKKSTGEFAEMLKCYLLSGLEGAVQTVHSNLLALKQNVAKLIFEKLCKDAAVPLYLHITGATHFGRLAPAELNAWQRQQAHAAVALQQQASTSAALPPSAGDQSAPVTEDAAPPVPPGSSVASPAITLSTTTATPALDMLQATGIFSVGTKELVTKKPRKVRFDKGKLCGPIKKMHTTRGAADPAGSGTGPSVSSGAHA
ncbi:hypothetical protein BC835DRAFT_1309675 [Cytidiella melzeri]|nr:hypothetical protein BC835DRAFT_1309675 [Cytidiella melzeri]